MIRLFKTPRAALAVILALPAALAACGGSVLGGGGNSGGSGGGCTVDGQTYAVGESIDLGCNTCTCMPDGDVACTDNPCPTVCLYAGVGYTPGSSFPDLDGCNTCTCMPDGGVTCTDKACTTSCSYAGVGYPAGASFPAIDGCNTCTCMPDGSVACTKMACQCDPEAEWWRNYVALDPATCQVIDYTCPANTTGFQNGCGCGCEQDPACPQWFDCMPPSSCDPAQIAIDCPYSGIAY